MVSSSRRSASKPELGFQIGHALLQLIDGLAFRIGQIAVFQQAVSFRRVRTTRPGMPTTVEPSGTGCTTTEPAPILTSSPIADAAQHFRARAHHHAIAKRRMAFAFLVARAAERHALVEQAVVADFGGLADHHA